ncbi:MAG: helix-turn-helix domain-containing protein, partial [Dehalococcoidia bacterium]
MDKIEVIKCSLEIQEQLRDQFVRLRKQGWKLEEISEAIGVYHSTIRNWSRKYNKGGIKALELKVKGRKCGEKRTLLSE